MEPATAAILKKPLLNYAEVATILGVQPGLVRLWVCQHQIPHVRLGPRTVRFDPDELSSWLERRRVPSRGPT